MHARPKTTLSVVTFPLYNITFLFSFSSSSSDCWDGPGSEPIIYHGWTLTSKLDFKEVLVDAVKPYAFFASEFPLILSIENHCSKRQQDKMAEHLTNVLGDLLYTGSVDRERKLLPSPKELKSCLLYTSPSPRDRQKSRMPSSA